MPPNPELLRTAINALRHARAGGHRLPAAEEAVIADVAGRVADATAGSDAAGAVAWHRAAVATLRMLENDNDRTHAAWIAACAELPPLADPS